MRNLSERIQNIVDQPVSAVRSLHGGMVGEVFMATLANGGRLVAKVASPDAMLAREGYMLHYLETHTDLPVPHVVHSDDTVLLMTFIEGNSSLTGSAQAHAADLLAAMHAITAPKFGLEEDTLIGPLHQPNPWTDSWLTFFREQRLLYMADVAHKAGRLPTRTRHRVDTLAAKLNTLIDEPEAPSLIHGDIWTTNVLAKDGRITAFIDPAIYYGHREIELAYTTLFGTFGDSFFKRYQEHYKIAPGFFEERRDLYNLYPLLVHVRLFGGGYVGSVERILSRFGV